MPSSNFIILGPAQGKADLPPDFPTHIVSDIVFVEAEKQLRKQLAEVSSDTVRSEISTVLFDTFACTGFKPPNDLQGTEVSYEVEGSYTEVDRTLNAARPMYSSRKFWGSGELSYMGKPELLLTSVYDVKFTI